MRALASENISTQQHTSKNFPMERESDVIIMPFADDDDDKLFPMFF